MSLQEYSIQDRRELFCHTTEYNYYIENDFAVNWLFLKGHCLEREYAPNSPHCDCHRSEELWAFYRRWGRLPSHRIGNCPKCLSAGTIGYRCQECHEELYKMLRKTNKAGKTIGTLNWIGPLHLADHHEKNVNWIIPRCPIVLAGHQCRPELWAEISEDDWNFLSRMDDEDVTARMMLHHTNKFKLIVDVYKETTKACRIHDPALEQHQLASRSVLDDYTLG